MIRSILENKVRRAILARYPGADISAIGVECSGTFGDYATNAALTLARALKKNPREVAEGLKKEIMETPREERLVASVTVAGPGFLNITLTNEAIVSDLGVLPHTLLSGTRVLGEEKIDIEFISANPTGDLHIGHGRGAFYGDALANILAFCGARVTREYYINDSRESNQIKELGKTAIGVGEQYKTPRLEKMIAEMNFSNFSGEENGLALAEKVQEYNRSFIEKKLHIDFNSWYSEDKNIRATGAADAMLDELKKKNLLYEKDGALWLKTSEYDDGEDQVVVRSDGTKSYFISDIFYHNEKFMRGYDRVIDVWGADHHGHVKRMHAVGKMLGWPQDPPQPIIFITQLVALKEGAERKKMSKRAGNVILLEDLVDELGIDVVRWFFSEKSLNTHMDFDMERARKQSSENPVYYVQYAHARICSILEHSKGLSSDGSALADALKEKSARALALKIAAFPEAVERIARDYQVHKLTTYAYELANAFSQFYRDVRVIENDTYNKGALELALLAKNTLGKTLSLLGISAPEKM